MPSWDGATCARAEKAASSRAANKSKQDDIAERIKRDLQEPVESSDEPRAGQDSSCSRPWFFPALCGMWGPQITRLARAFVSVAPPDWERSGSTHLRKCVAGTSLDSATMRRLHPRTQFGRL